MNFKISLILQNFSLYTPFQNHIYRTMFLFICSYAANLLYFKAHLSEMVLGGGPLGSD